jgi:hypothetical protein
MSRADETQTARRRRNGDQLTGNRNRMAVDTSTLDRENFEYRFINDVGTRVHDLTVRDDWDIVSDRDGKVKGDTAGDGAQVAVNAGNGADGKPVRAILVRKPKDFYKTDDAAKQRQIDAQEAALKGGSTPGGDQANQYVPNSQSSPLSVGRK